METTVLNNQDVFPTEEVLKNALGKTYSVLFELLDILTKPDYGLIPEWNYYKDGKAWLCKVSHKKKTVFWLSVWDKYFKIGFYFTEKNSQGISDLDIEKKIKEDFINGNPIGKLIPLEIDVNDKKQIGDVLKIIEYKMKIK
jgi:hypothetical protein